MVFDIIPFHLTVSDDTQWEMDICIVMDTYVYLWHRQAYTHIQNGLPHKCFEYMFDTQNYLDVCLGIL